MNIYVLVGGALVGALALGCAAKESAAPATNPGGPAVAQGPTLDEVAAKAPAVLYFVKKDCGSNPRAIPLVQKIYAANSGGGKFYVVMNADADTAAEWSKENGTTFPIIPDPDKKLIEKYGVVSSQTGVLVDASLSETKRFAGFGRAVLQELNQNLGGGEVDLADAPESGVG